MSFIHFCQSHPLLSFYSCEVVRPSGWWFTKYALDHVTTARGKTTRRFAKFAYLNFSWSTMVDSGYIRLLKLFKIISTLLTPMTMLNRTLFWKWLSYVRVEPELTHNLLEGCHQHTWCKAHYTPNYTRTLHGGSVIYLSHTSELEQNSLWILRVVFINADGRWKSSYYQRLVMFSFGEITCNKMYTLHRLYYDATSLFIRSKYVLFIVENGTNWC